MSKPKSERLDVVRKLAQRKEQRAAQALLSHRQRLDREQHQLEQLQDYYADYIERIEKQTQTSITEVITYREFSQRLATAVKQQQQRISVFESDLEVANKQWLLLREKRLAIEDVIDRSRNQEQSERERIEQKLLDEIANTKSPKFISGQSI